MPPDRPRGARIDERPFAPVSCVGSGPLLVAEGPALYRPRQPERTAFYKFLDRHSEEFLRVHEERFEPEDGPLRPVVRDAVAAFLDCGVPRGGFARARCPECRPEYHRCFSCRTRLCCPSCQQQRVELLAEKLRRDVLAPVAHPSPAVLGRRPRTSGRGGGRRGGRPGCVKITRAGGGPRGGGGAAKPPRAVHPPVPQPSRAVPGRRPSPRGRVGAGRESRRVAFTIPKVLRPTFFRERRLLGLFPRCAFRP